jgi:hypothetical protein
MPAGRAKARRGGTADRGSGAISRLVGRLPRIIIAYIVASPAAGVALGFLNLITSPPSGGETFTQALGKALAVGGLLVGSFVAIYAVLPALLLVVLAESFGWRRWPVYVGVSALLGIGTNTLLENGAVNLKAILIFAAAGAFAGFIYWAIAGRSAGLHGGERA